jgi:hypothetical protein
MRKRFLGLAALTFAVFPILQGCSYSPLTPQEQSACNSYGQALKNNLSTINKGSSLSDMQTATENIKTAAQDDIPNSSNLLAGYLKNQINYLNQLESAMAQVQTAQSVAQLDEAKALFGAADTKWSSSVKQIANHCNLTYKFL